MLNTNVGSPVPCLMSSFRLLEVPAVPSVNGVFQAPPGQLRWKHWWQFSGLLLLSNSNLLLALNISLGTSSWSMGSFGGSFTLVPLPLLIGLSTMVPGLLVRVPVSLPVLATMGLIRLRESWNGIESQMLSRWSWNLLKMREHTWRHGIWIPTTGLKIMYTWGLHQRARNQGSQALWVHSRLVVGFPFNPAYENLNWVYIALWHGISPGYYLTFVMGAFIQSIAKCISLLRRARHLTSRALMLLMQSRSPPLCSPIVSLPRWSQTRPI